MAKTNVDFYENLYQGYFRSKFTKARERLPNNERPSSLYEPVIFMALVHQCALGLEGEFDFVGLFSSFGLLETLELLGDDASEGLYQLVYNELRSDSELDLRRYTVRLGRVPFATAAEIIDEFIELSQPDDFYY